MANTGPRILVIDGVTYIYDQVRAKILSTARVYLRAGVHSRKVTNQYARLEDGQPAMTVGDALTRPATIVGLTANCETAATWTFEVYRKGSALLVTSLSVVAATVAQTTVLNVDLNTNDVLLFKINGTNVPFPRGMLELAWRLP